MTQNIYKNRCVVDLLMLASYRPLSPEDRESMFFQNVPTNLKGVQRIT